MTYGSTFTLINPRNPLGLYFKARFLELGISQKELADKIGIRQSAIANVFGVHGDSPSFSTAMGSMLTDALLAEERRQWYTRWQAGLGFWGGRSYPKGRPETVRKACYALSLWNASSKVPGSSNRDFFELMRFMDKKTYREMIHMMWTPYYGALVANDNMLKHVRVVSSYRVLSKEQLDRTAGLKHRQRETVADLVFEAEQSNGWYENRRIERIVSAVGDKPSLKDVLSLLTREEAEIQEDEFVYDAQVISDACSGNTEKALVRIANRWENYGEMRREKDEAIWAAMEADGTLVSSSQNDKIQAN